jgi:hypothetical protein
MAIINPIHGEMSGSIAGNTWSRNKGGQYVRQRTTPTNPTTSRQTIVRSWMQTLSSAYASLTQAQRDAWKQYGETHPVTNALGVSIILSGQQWFVALNSRRLDIGSAVVATPPAVNEPAPLTSMTAAASEGGGTITVTFTPTPLSAGQRLAVWATAPGTPGADPSFSQARLQGYGASAGTSPETIPARWSLIQGAVTNIYVARLDGATGLVSTVQKSRVTVGA